MPPGRVPSYLGGPLLILAGMEDFLAWSGWAFVAIPLAVIAIIVGVVTARTWGNRRGRLVYRVDVNPMIHGQAPSGIRITHRGAPLSEPWLATVSLTNTGPRDVTAANFHGGAWARIELGARVVVALDAEATGPAVRESGTGVEIEPFHLPRGSRVAFTCLLDGHPGRPSMTALVDTDVELAQRSVAEAFEHAGGLVGAVTAGMGVAAGGAGWLVEATSRVIASLIGGGSRR
jgi:hypothetical protein